MRARRSYSLSDLKEKSKDEQPSTISTWTRNYRRAFEGGQQRSASPDSETSPVLKSSSPESSILQESIYFGLEYGQVLGPREKFG